MSNFKHEDGNNVNLKIEVERRFMKGNTFTPNAKGFAIMDTYNNPSFPLVDILIDKSNFDSNILVQEYRRVYGYTKSDIFMPWHFQLEMVGREFTVQNTRPVNYLSNIKGFEEFICICIVGNSHNDVYTPDLYKKLANLCILPYTKSRVNQVPEKLEFPGIGKSLSKTQIIKLL